MALDVIAGQDLHGGTGVHVNGAAVEAVEIVANQDPPNGVFFNFHDDAGKCNVLWFFPTRLDFSWLGY
jgi:hypothetical protein